MSTPSADHGNKQRSEGKANDRPEGVEDQIVQLGNAGAEKELARLDPQREQETGQGCLPELARMLGFVVTPSIGYRS